MGWVESPPIFSVTETICDLSNNLQQSGASTPSPHWLDPIVNSPKLPPLGRPHPHSSSPPRARSTPLNLATKQATNNQVKLTCSVLNFIEDFWLLTNQLNLCPTRFCELIPTTPTFLGACDAAGTLGMGGVWFPPVSSVSPL